MMKIFPSEKLYLPYLSKNPRLMALYKLWKCKQGLFKLDAHLDAAEDCAIRSFLRCPDEGYMEQWIHLFPDREERNERGWSIVAQRPLSEAKEKLRSLRKANSEALCWVAPAVRDRYIIYRGSVYLFVLDQLRTWLEQTLRLFHSYYGNRMPKEQTEAKLIVEGALLGALLENHPARRLDLYIDALTSQSALDPSYYWGVFWRVDIWERFKEHLYRQIGRPTAGLAKLEDNDFRVAFEREWRRALGFRDRGGFWIVPLFTDDDMARYASLPRRNQYIVYEMVDYVVLKICPKLLQTLDHIEPARFRRWQALLLSLTRPLVDQVVRQHERVKAQGSSEASRRRLTQKAERELRGYIESEILSLATRDYYVLYGKKQIPKAVLRLDEKIRALHKKMAGLAKNKGSFEEMQACLQEENELLGRLKKEFISWEEQGGYWSDYWQVYLPWGHLIGVRFDEVVRRTHDEDIYPLKPIRKRIQRLRREYLEALAKKDQARSKELLGKLKEARRKEQTTRRVIKMGEDSRWMYPSYFIRERIRKISVAPRTMKSSSASDSTGQGEPGKESDAEGSWEKEMADGALQEALATHDITPQHFSKHATAESLRAKQSVLPPNIIERDKSGNKKEYVGLGKLAVMVGCSWKTLIRMERCGEIKFEPKRVRGREVVEKGGKQMRLFPVEQIDEIRLCFIRDKSIAKRAGVPAYYLSRLKKKLRLDELPRVEQKKKLVEWAKKRCQCSK